MVVAGGDYNTDFLRMTPFCDSLRQFLIECDLVDCNALEFSDVPFTFLNSTLDRSNIDHFFVSRDCIPSVSECAIIKNHLHSDHVPLVLK